MHRTAVMLIRYMMNNVCMGRTFIERIDECIYVYLYLFYVHRDRDRDRDTETHTHIFEMMMITCEGRKEGKSVMYKLLKRI